MRHFKNTPLLKGLILSASSLVLAACGGGGGDGGGFPGGPTPADHIELRMSASRTSLPQNISMVRSSIGGPFTSSVTVEAIARDGNRYIPATATQEEFFACNVIQGIDSVSLYYHDGADEHYTEVEEIDPTTGQPVKVKYENAYRSVVSGANSGAFTFHVASTNKAGTAVVRCTATDAQAGKSASTEMTFTVGNSSAQPTSIRVRDSNSVDYNASARRPLYIQSMNQLNQLQLQASVVDESGNPVPDPSSNAANIKAEILPSSTATGGKLITSGQSGQSVMVRTINGIAQITVQAGITPGALVVLFTGDALDNNVSNGISLPITQSIAIPVADANSVGTMEILGLTPPTAMVGTLYTGTVEVQGGYSPVTYPDLRYSCTASGTLPPGLRMMKSCELTGTPTKVNVDDKGNPAPYKFTVTATQEGVDPAVAGLDLTVSAEVELMVYAKLTLTSANVTAAAGTPFTATLTADGGAPPYTWEVTSSTCAGAAVDNKGNVTGTAPATAGDTCTVNVTVTDSVGNTADGKVTVTAS